MKKTVEQMVKTSDPDTARSLKILEIGAYAGGSALVWGRALKNNSVTDGKFISVDPWDSYIDLTGNRRIVFRVMNRNLGNGNVLRLFVQNLTAAGVSDVCHQFRGRSEDILPMLNTKFDIIYIDASHHVDAVTKDLELSFPLLKVGGIICGAGLERQLEDFDPDFLKAHFHTDLYIDPKTGQTFHPGITHAVGTCFGRRISHYGGYWVVRKNGEKFYDVVLKP